ncbi:MAG: hypothetical protein ABI692_09635 [Terracoccus sp.]
MPQPALPTQTETLQPTETSSASDPPQRSGLPGRVGTGLIVLLVVGALLFYGTPGADLARYALFLALGVVMPGTLVHRALRGPMESWLSDLSLGAATGLALGLVAWAAASLADVRSVLWAWPVLTLAVLFSPGARARIRARPRRRWPAGPTLVVTLACLAVGWQLAWTFLSVYDLPPSGRPYYPDLLWHLGLAAEATRAFPLGTPQAVESGLLHYHWFSNAHVATTSLMTGIDEPTIMLRLWLLPMGMVFVGMTAALTERVSGRPWAAAGAAVIAIPVVTYAPWPYVVMPLGQLSGNSPSQLFAYPMILLTVHALVDVVRGRLPLAGALAASLIGAVGASGSKASALPVILGGLALSSVAALAQRRRRRLLLVVTAIAALMTALALRLVAGGNSGSGVQFLSVLSWKDPYRLLVSARPNLHTPYLGGLVDKPGFGLSMGAGLMMATLFGAVRSLAFVVPVLQRRLRRDLAAWLLAGICASAFVPFFLLAHDGYSEVYFIYGTVPVGAALWLWSVSELVTSTRTRPVVVISTVAVVVAATTWLGLRASAGRAPTNAGQMRPRFDTFLLQSAVLAAVVVLGVGLALVIRRRAGRPAFVTVLLIALLSPVAGALVVQSSHPLRQQASTVSDPALVSQGRAAAWIRANVPSSALLATDTHCLSGSGLKCNSRRWWLSGLSGRRVLLESWSYLPEAAHVGFRDVALYNLNQRAYTAPTPDGLSQLRAKGVGWLVSERVEARNGLKPVSVSPRLAELATKRYDDGTIAVYELR